MEGNQALMVTMAEIQILRALVVTDLS